LKANTEDIIISGALMLLLIGYSYSIIRYIVYKLRDYYGIYDTEKIEETL